jgi:hypothetical protein
VWATRAVAGATPGTAAGLDGDEQAMARVHLILRDLLGPIALTPGKKGELGASYRLNSSALAKATGTHGRGDRI